MHAAEHKRWLKPNRLAREVFYALAKWLEGVDESEWTAPVNLQVLYPVLLATDASQDRLGYTAFALDEDGITFSLFKTGSQLRADRSTSINIEETNAVSFAFSELELEPKWHKKDALILLVDNTTSSRAIYKGHSTSIPIYFKTREIISNVLRSLPAERFGIVDIPSEFNDADVLTKSNDLTSQDFFTRREATILRGAHALVELKRGEMAE